MHERFQYIEAPAKYDLDTLGVSIFLAGGITECRDWQVDAKNALSDLPLSILNPRREAFDITKKEMSDEQIKWEFQALRDVDIVAFWFSSETIQPITLFELGSALERHNLEEIVVIVGSDTKYSRLEDIKVQSELTGVQVIPDWDQWMSEVRKASEYLLRFAII